MPNKKRIIVLGTGFASFSFLRNVDVSNYDVTVVSPRNFFLFTPLLASTTVGTLEFRSISEPIRTFRRNVAYHQAKCQSIDHSNHKIKCISVLQNQEFELEYDYLIVGVGAINNTFGTPGVEEHTLFLKELWDARAIRQSILDCFEMADTPGMPDDEVKRLLHFVIVGGGPTGVELAAEIHDFLDEDIRRWYPMLAERVQITVVEALDHLLNSFDQKLSEYAANSFKRQKIEVLTKSMVAEVKKNELILKGGKSITFGLAVWSTGNAPSPLVSSLEFDKNKKGRLKTDNMLRVLGQPEVYAIGDCATMHDRNIPETAQGAMQMGKYLATSFNRSTSGKKPKPFRYNHMGMLAYVGDNRALADLSNWKGSGIFTWLFWRSAYLTRLISWKNKILVLIDWWKAWVFGRDISRF